MLNLSDSNISLVSPKSERISEEKRRSGWSFVKLTKLKTEYPHQWVKSTSVCILSTVKSSVNFFELFLPTKITKLLQLFWRTFQYLYHFLLYHVPARNFCQHSMPVYNELKLLYHWITNSLKFCVSRQPPFLSKSISMILCLSSRDRGYLNRSSHPISLFF